MLRLLCAALVPPTLTVGAVALLLGSLGLFAQALLLSAVVPDPPLLLRLFVASGGMVLGISLSVGSLVGSLEGLRRLRRQGAWLGLQSLGVSGKKLLFPVLVPLGASVLLQLAVAHGLEPASRRMLREARVQASSQLRPVEGRSLRIGGWSVTVQGDHLYFAGDRYRGSAKKWSLEPEREGIRMSLEQGVLSDWKGTFSLRFSSLGSSIPLPGGSGHSASELNSLDLYQGLQKKKHPERHPYERWLLWKRSLLPMVSLLLGLGSLPAGLGQRSIPWISGGLLVGFWGGVRVLDTTVEELGVGAAAALILLLPAGIGLFCWGRWKER